MDKCIKNYKLELIKKLVNLYFNNLKDYWKIFNVGSKNNLSVVDINDMFEFLKGMNECEVDNNNENLLEVVVMDIYDFLNFFISDEEILEVVKKFKNNKLLGYDLVINEYIFIIVIIFLLVYRKLFNLIYDRGYVLDEWLIGIIKFIFKNKGDFIQLENYRLIILFSCFGKLFICILSKCLDMYVFEINFIISSQVGFRKNYLILDYILIF